jgi:hemoglobin-like flavoprotein
MKKEQKERMYRQIVKHGNDLKTIFNLEGDPITLCKKVHRLETKAHNLATDYCNGAITTEQWEGISEGLLKSLDKVLNFVNQGIPVIVNGDARGYTLKIKDSYVKEHDLDIHRDWGGYGIIAPDFDGKE